MKRFIILLWLPVALSLTSCAKKVPLSDDFSAYRGMTAQQLLVKAEKKLADEDFVKANKDLQALDALYPYGREAKQGVVDAVYSYHMSDQDELALAVAERYLQFYPDGQAHAYILYMKGVINYNKGLSWLQRNLSVDPATLNLQSNTLAFSAFSTLVRQHPHSIYAADSLARMHYLRDAFARHQYLIADYYYSRHAYVAAINRANLVVMHYNGTSTVKPALALMIRCYDKLGLRVLQAKTQALMDRSFTAAA